MSLSKRFRTWKYRHRWRRRQRPGNFGTAYIGNGICLTRLASGRLMYVVASDRSVAPLLIMSGLWERRPTRLLTDILKPGMNFLDVGANVGYFALLAADLVGGAGWVGAIEANPTLADLAEMTLQINGHRSHTNVYNVAADNKAGNIELRVLPGLLGSSSLTMRPETAAAWKEKIESVIVEAATIDEIVDGRRIDVMKLDVEGSELRALQGAERTLRSNPRIQIIMEFSPAMLGGPRQARELLDLLQSYGLGVFRIGTKGVLKKLSYDDQVELSMYDQTDVFFKAA